MSSYLDSLYTVCKALSEQTGEDELVPMLKAMQAENAALKEQVAQLATAIAEAAIKAGIITEDVSLTGPQVLMICADMGAGYATLQAKSAALVDALNEIVYSRPLVDQQIQLEILAALTAFKRSENE